MTDTEEMTPTQRAEAYEAEAAQLLDKVTHRGYWSGEVSPEAAKFVDLIVQAAVLRMTAEMAPARCSETWQPAVGGDVGRCTLLTGHTGKHLMASQSGAPWAYPGEVCHDSPTARGELASGLTQDEAGRRAQAADRVEFNQQNRCHVSGVAGICYLPHDHDGDHTFR